MSQRTVLIVDYNEEDREIFARYLEFVGGTVLTASNGEEGFRMAEEHLPDLILLDLAMPVLDGWETLKRLQQEPATASIPVVALTAHHLPEERLEAAGFCGYLEKPLVLYRVLEEVERCIGRLDMTALEAAWRSAAERPNTFGESSARAPARASRKRALRPLRTAGGRYASRS